MIAARRDRNSRGKCSRSQTRRDIQEGRVKGQAELGCYPGYVAVPQFASQANRKGLLIAHLWVRGLNVSDWSDVACMCWFQVNVRISVK